MATLLNRVWLCELDLDDWESVSTLVHPANYPSPRLPEDARIATAVSAALVRVAIHEIAGPTFETPAQSGSAHHEVQSGYAHREAKDTSLPLEQIQHSISHAPGTITVAVGTGTLGVDVEAAHDAESWGRARGKAAIKASGAALLGSERQLVLDLPGGCQVGGNALWVADVPDCGDYAVAVASSITFAPIVVHTSARQILERCRETFDRATGVETHERAARARRSRLA